MFLIGGLQKTTLIDFPSKIAAIVFTQGCNLRCGYCHNPELLDFEPKPNYTTDDFFDFLKLRRGKLDGVVITGGEPTLQSGLFDFVQKVKSLGFAVKLDTNGTNPAMLKNLIDAKLLDYIAMDIKSPLDKYELITGRSIRKEDISKSIELIMTSGVDYEFRTTVVKSMLDLDDFVKIGEMINGAKQYYLQKFIPSKIYDEKLLNSNNYTDSEFNIICKRLEKYVENVAWR